MNTWGAGSPVDRIRWVACEALLARQRARADARTLWAQHDRETVLVFQAYRPEIGRAAVAAGTLAVPGFALTRATWIKPGYLWMMHRSDWARSEGQEVVLGLVVARAWFEAVLGRAELSTHAAPEPGGAARRATDVVVQWDPDWGPRHQRQPWRAIQIGLRPDAVPGYLAAIRAVIDLTPEVVRGREAVAAGADPLVPDADVLELADAEARRRLGL